MADRVGALMRALIDGGARVIIGPDAGIGPHKPHHVLPYAIADMRLASTPTSSPSTATRSPTSTPSTAASPCSTGDTPATTSR
jgi:hypothetical protein